MLTRKELSALWRVLKHRPLFTLLITVFGFLVAFLEGIGMTFILPIINFARDSGDEPSSNEGLINTFQAAFDFLGVPFTLQTVIVAVIFVLALRYAASICMSWFQALLELDYERSLKINAFDNALGASISYFDNQGSDEILNAVITQAGSAAGTIGKIVSLAQTALISLMYFAIALYIAPVLTAATIVGLGGITLVVRYFVESGQSIGESVVKANEEVQIAAQAGTQGIRDVKLYGLVDDISDRFITAINLKTSATVQQSKNRAIINNLYRFVSAMAVFALIYAALTISSLSLGSLGVFLFAMYRLAPRVSTLNKMFYELENQVPHLTETLDFIDELESYREPDSGSKFPPSPVREVTFKNVTFGYEADEQVLENITFSAERNEFVAFVGQSGAGKSTVVSLLARMYRPDSGRITANGTPIEEINLEEWRSTIAVVRQDPFVFNDTLRYNLTIGNQDATDAEIERACEIAQVTEFIDDLPEGYDTVLGDDGVKLSGGQRQRVALARALLKDADVLVLDEATSDLDTGIESKVQSAIESMDREYIVIAIAHRLSTVRNADRIYTFEDGSITERGTHNELIQDDDKYAELYSTQANRTGPIN